MQSEVTLIFLFDLTFFSSLILHYIKNASTQTTLSPYEHFLPIARRFNAFEISYILIQYNPHQFLSACVMILTKQEREGSSDHGPCTFHMVAIIIHVCIALLIAYERKINKPMNFEKNLVMSCCHT